MGRRGKECWVYFIQEVFTQAIKIGSSIYPGSRIGSLQVGNAYDLVYLGALAGGEDEERKVHHRFRKHRLKGEWFNREIGGDVKRLLATDGWPYPAIMLCDYTETHVTKEFVISVTGHNNFKSWVDEWDYRAIKGSKGKIFDRMHTQILLGKLSFLEEALPEVRDTLLGNKPDTSLLF